MTAPKAITVHNWLTWFTGIISSILLIGVVGLWNMGVKNHDSWIRFETVPEDVREIKEDIDAIQRIPFINSELNKQSQQ